MSLNLRPVREEDVESLVRLSLLTWEPVFASFRQILGPEIYAIIWPDWKTGQQDAVEKICQEGEETFVWVAELEGEAVGFVAYELRPADQTGEVQLLAVHPDYQGHGIGAQLLYQAVIDTLSRGVNRITLNTQEHNQRSHALYQRFGFVQTDQRVPVLCKALK